MWRATKVSADAAQNMQVDAGILLNTFDVTTPVEPADADIICATSGDFSITCQPETEDFFEDVNNAPNNTMEGKRITGWNCGLTVNCLEAKEETLVLALGAADVGADGGINPRVQYRVSDFKGLYWIGDMVDEDKVLCVVMDHTVSTDGLALTTTKNGKGQIALTLTPHASLANMDKVPMAFYILEKDDDAKMVNIKQTLSHVGSTITDTSVITGGSVTGTLTADEDYTLENVVVLMNGEDVTDATYSAGTVTISSVTGEVEIIATATYTGA